MANDRLLDKVTLLRRHLEEIKMEVGDVHDHDFGEYPRTVAWDYYRLVDLLSTALLVAHRLEKILIEPGK